MKNDKRAHFMIAVVCFLLGMLLVAQFRGVQTDKNVTSIQRAQELSAQLKTVTEERDMYKKELIELRNRITEYENAASETSSFTEAMKKELEKVRMHAGLIAGTGKGVVITLDDSNLPRQPGEDPNLFLIHDEDLLKVINELFAAGAEAVSVNGQRIVTNSEIRCVGPTIIINSVKLAPPFVINAVGDPEILETALKMRGGVIESLQVFGIQVSIKKQDKIEIPAYTGPIQFKYFKPVKAGES
ncbi:MAG TPA: DUF881 domain-containing protein [Thermoanaerobacterales bacterium]|uniref:DUF881 domain-containing protein n=1 Tax=Tepidanaerobacter sp. GT38 TaxID=2722793 RepID=UPI00180FA39D|nr:DUF881 domain-containing protein [Tepidanaerobacter sp. GT38]MCG1012171.1 DUF881 domain-containing protein [Tepidanaerobacter sp. GT38]HHY42369.1 DUF881 domain-containing protein [Thermoanaerobacterales bacterium]